MTAADPHLPRRMRSTILAIASALFYRDGVRAVGMDALVAASGIAKTTIYRHFPNKDALIEAFLEEEDRTFWQQWDLVIAEYGKTPFEALLALCGWVGAKVERDGYRGCPQINVAAEFADTNHPASRIARRHKAHMVDRLRAICATIDPTTADLRAQQIGLLFDGAFMSNGRLGSLGAGRVLSDAVKRLSEHP